ncbi:MmpS family transport accessory protein [Micromonospora sediminicola]|uniref:MmpS family transport accessory protein n=1 Tax=Micromonospora sediminicola TaxID=946078 RepID=UPI0037A55DD2
MSETTPAPEPGSGPSDPPPTPAHPAATPSDPIAPPAASSWTPPDPLAAPQPWTPPAPWSPPTWAPGPWTGDHSGTSDPAGTPGPTERPDTPGQGVDQGPGRPTGAPAGGAGWAAPEAAGHPRPAVPPAVTPAGWSGDPAVPSPGDTGGPPPGGPAAPGWPPAAYPPAAYPPATYPPAAYPPGAYPPGPYPPPYAYPGGTPRRSTGGWAVGLVVTVVAALVLAFCGCVGLGVLGAFVDDSTSSGEPYDDPYLDDPDGIVEEPTPTAPVTTPSGGPGRFTVVYEVTATGPVDVQFYDAGENLLHLDDVASPWRLRLTANNRERVQVTATPAGPDAGDVTCRITVDGREVYRNSGRWGATCFGW